MPNFQRLTPKTNCYVAAESKEEQCKVQPPFVQNMKEEKKCQKNIRTEEKGKNLFHNQNDKENNNWLTENKKPVAFRPAFRQFQA